jgi:predicted Zn-dependent peptidase
LGQYALGKQTNAQLAQLYGWYEVLGLGREFDRTFQTAIAQVSAQDIQTVADRYFAAPHMVLTGPAAAVEPALLVTP